MRPSRVALALLILALLAGGMAGVSGGSERAPRQREAKTTSVAASGGQGEAATEPPRFLEVAKRVADRREAVRVSEDDATLVAEVSALQLLAAGTGLELDGAQWSALAAATLELQAVRQAFEAEIATITRVAPGRYRMDIPGYPAAGAALRAKFYARLGAELGEVVAAEIADRLGTGLEGHLGAFGVSVQTLEIVGDVRGSLADVEVTRTVTYWNRAEDGEKLVTRRETHLPAWEDPAGGRWGAVLAAAAGAPVQVNAEG